MAGKSGGPVSISNCPRVFLSPAGPSSDGSRWGLEDRSGGEHKGIGMIWIRSGHVPVDEVLVGLDASPVCISQSYHTAKTVKVIKDRLTYWRCFEDLA